MDQILICPKCGASMADGICGCQKPQVTAKEIPKESVERLARGAIRGAAAAFERQDVRDDFERWLAERQKSLQKGAIA